MSLTELQDRMLERVTGRKVDALPEGIVLCVYPDWLEARMRQHRDWVKSHFPIELPRTQAMKKIIHEQFYAASRH